MPKRGYKFIGGVSRSHVAEAAVAPMHASLTWPVIAVLAIVALGALAFLHFHMPAPEARVVRSTILPPEKTTFAFTTNRSPMSLSPNGRRMVFGATGQDGKSQLWVRELDSGMAQPLPGTEGAQFPFWSPDSRWVGFFAEGKLRKIDTRAVPRLCWPMPPMGAAERGARKVSSYSRPPAPVLCGRSPAGGDPAPATDLSAVVAHTSPWFLPDGEHFLFHALKGANGRLLVGSLASTASAVVGEAHSNAQYSQGRLLYLRGTTLMAQPFDEKALRASPEAVPVAEQVEQIGAGGVGVFTVAGGLLAFQTGDGLAALQLTWFDRAGNKIATIGEPREFHDISLSPDRKTLAASVRDANGNYDLWTYDLPGETPTRLTLDPGAADQFGVWSSDGQNIAFNSTRRGHWDIYEKSSNGAGAENVVYADNQEKHITSWSRDGRFQLFFTIGDQQGSHLWILPLTPEQRGAPLRPVPFLGTKFTSGFGQFSPDDQWVAYGANESQRPEIYAVPFSRPTEKHQISTSGGNRPRWRQDGKEIFYLTRTGDLMAAEVRIARGALKVVTLKMLFGGFPTLSGYPYDASADGQRILAAMPTASQKAPEPITLVENWSVALKK